MSSVSPLRRRPTRPLASTLAGALTSTLAAGLMCGCAATGTPSDGVGEAAPAANEALAPASAEAREIADRMPPLERANFWAIEYAKTPEDAETALSFADALARIGSHERAGEVLIETEVIHPGSAEVKLRLARSLSAQNQFAGARRALEAAARLAPENADILAALGLANDRLGDHASAQMAYRQALSLDPDRAITLANLGLSLALTGDLPAAEMRLRRAAELNGANTTVRQNLALVLGLQGRFEEMFEAGGDAPADIMQRNAEALMALRGDSPPVLRGQSAGPAGPSEAYGQDKPRETPPSDLGAG
ncbi:MAG: tetratricopeptide repeat protein [Pseudomonadota bacterium]